MLFITDDQFNLIRKRRITFYKHAKLCVCHYVDTSFFKMDQVFRKALLPFLWVKNCIAMLSNLFTTCNCINQVEYFAFVTRELMEFFLSKNGFPGSCGRFNQVQIQTLDGSDVHHVTNIIWIHIYLLLGIFYSPHNNCSEDGCFIYHFHRKCSKREMFLFQTPYTKTVCVYVFRHLQKWRRSQQNNYVRIVGVHSP